MWDLIVSVPDHCLSLYFKILHTLHFKRFKAFKYRYLKNTVVSGGGCGL